jgi:hypothetical protein
MSAFGCKADSRMRDSNFQNYSFGGEYLFSENAVPVELVSGRAINRTIKIRISSAIIVIGEHSESEIFVDIRLASSVHYV